MKIKNWLVTKEDFEGRGWIHQAIGWGIGMFLIMGVIFPLVNNEIVNAQTLFRDFLIWMLGGFVVALLAKFFIKFSD